MVTCLASHLTQIGVEELAVDKQSAAADDSAVVVTNTTVTLTADDESLQQVDMWGSWAVYNSFIMLGVLGAGIVWGYSRDKRDELNLKKVFLNREKIYMNLFLEPLPNDELARVEDDDNDYEAIQQEKARRQEEKKKKLEERAEKYRGTKVDMNAPVMGLFSPEEMQAKFGITVERPVTAVTVAADVRGDSEVKKKKKKKKKKAAVAVVANSVHGDMFFEGGDSALNEYEGGSDEELGADEAAESVKPKSKKKGKKKKKVKNADTLKSGQMEAADTFKESPTIVVEGVGDQTPARPQDKQPTDLMIEEVDGKSVKSKRSRSKSLTKKKAKKKKKVTNDHTELPPEEDIQINPISLSNFVQPAEAHQAEAVPDVPSPEVVLQQEEETKSKRSKKGSKRKGRGNRSSSAHRSQHEQADEEGAINPEDLNNDLRADIEAEEISPSRKREPVPLALDRENLFKPVTEYEKERLNNMSPEKKDSGDLVSSKSKKKKKKGRKLKKKKKAEESDEDEEDEEEEDDDEEENEEENVEQKKEREEDEEPSGCCQFCFWNFREGHRCLSFFSYYNSELNRPSRWVILVMSWFLFQVFSGFFMGGPEVRLI